MEHLQITILGNDCIICKFIFTWGRNGRLRYFSIIEHLNNYEDDGTISSLTIEVRGKAEKKIPAMLVLYANDIHPWLDPIRFTLLFMQIVGHRSGCLLALCKTLEDAHNYLTNDTLVRSAPK